MCDFCSACTDSTKHMFWECNKVQHLWSEVSIMIQNKFGLEHNTHLTFEIISFCNLKCTRVQNNNAINFIILLAKYFIFKCKCESIVPLFPQYMNYLTHRLKIEETISHLKHTHELFSQRWSTFLENTAV